MLRVVPAAIEQRKDSGKYGEQDEQRSRHCLENSPLEAPGILDGAPENGTNEGRGLLELSQSSFFLLGREGAGLGGANVFRGSGASPSRLWSENADPEATHLGYGGVNLRIWRRCRDQEIRDAGNEVEPDRRDVSRAAAGQKIAGQRARS